MDHPVTSPPRPFNLRLYLGLTTGITVAVLGLGLWFAFSMIMTNSMLRISERYATAIAGGIHSRIMEEYAFDTRGQPPDFSDPQTAARLDRIVRRNLGAFGIERIKIYDQHGCIVYSTTPEQIGQCDPENEHFQEALTGKPVAELQRSGETGDLRGERFKVDSIETYVPINIRSTDRATFPSVFEIYQDITALRRSLMLSNVIVLVVLLIAMGLFFFIQTIFARRADRLIRQQHQILEQRNQELEELQQFKADLTNMIVHDMKSPLTAVMGYLKLLQRGVERNPPEQNRHMVDQAHQASEQLLDMIMNLLDISRIEEGKLSLKREPVDLPELADLVARPFTPELQETRKQLTFDFAPDLPPIPADRDMLRRVLTNLISNAIKHTESAGAITLRAAIQDSEFRISVLDNGEGIPADAIPHLFRKFSQVTAKKLGQRTDTGLGLAFCKLAVEAHGGRIWVESEVGRGSNFTLALPQNPNEN